MSLSKLQSKLDLMTLLEGAQPHNEQTIAGVNHVAGDSPAVLTDRQ